MKVFFVFGALFILFVPTQCDKCVDHRPTPSKDTFDEVFINTWTHKQLYIPKTEFWKERMLRSYYKCQMHYNCYAMVPAFLYDVYVQACHKSHHTVFWLPVQRVNGTFINNENNRPVSMVSTDKTWAWGEPKDDPKKNCAVFKCETSRWYVEDCEAKNWFICG
uniref:Salivary C-type lectin n=1 Tax=Sergentomyia schwetzi TaxID=114605 RepID=A0A6B9VLE0_9DIPT|nr:hypothetical protein [Sergentomyia schwetzi]